MKKLSLSAGILSLVAALVVAGFCAGDDKQASTAGENKIASLERFIGEWEVHGRWAGGEELYARDIVEWGVGKKFLKGKTFVKKGASEYQRYDIVMGWHPKKNSLFETSFAFNGEIREAIIESVDQDTLHIGFKPFHEGEPSNIRSIIKFKGKDSYVWTVLMKDGENWKQLIEATWNRKK